MGNNKTLVARVPDLRVAFSNDNDAISVDAIQAELARCRLRLQRAASLVATRKWQARVRQLEAALAGPRR